MVNVEKQISCWRSSSEEDWEVAQALVVRGSIRHGLFFAHLALVQFSLLGLPEMQ